MRVLTPMPGDSGKPRSEADRSGNAEITFPADGFRFRINSHDFFQKGKFS